MFTTPAVAEYDEVHIIFPSARSSIVKPRPYALPGVELVPLVPNLLVKSVPDELYTQILP